MARGHSMAKSTCVPRWRQALLTRVVGRRASFQTYPLLAFLSVRGVSKASRCLVLSNSCGCKATKKENSDAGGIWKCISCIGCTCAIVAKFLGSEYLNSSLKLHSSSVRKRWKHPEICRNSGSEHMQVWGHINSLFLKQFPAWFPLACLHGHLQLPCHFKVPKCLRTENSHQTKAVAFCAILNTTLHPEEYLANTCMWFWILLSILSQPAHPEHWVQHP